MIRGCSLHAVNQLQSRDVDTGATQPGADAAVAIATSMYISLMISQKYRAWQAHSPSHEVAGRLLCGVLVSSIAMANGAGNRAGMRSSQCQYTNARVDIDIKATSDLD